MTFTTAAHCRETATFCRRLLAGAGVPRRRSCFSSARLVAAFVVALPVLLTGQGGGVTSADLHKPLANEWPTYSGDYSGKRYSALKQIDRLTVKRLSLAWVSALTTGAQSGGGARGPVVLGGEGTENFPAGTANIKGTPLMVDGTLYVSSPDNAWALDARDGRPLWHYFWKTRGGTHIANRGLGMWGNFLYMATPDNYLVSLDARTGRERWHSVIADFTQQYFSTSAPIVVDNHVLIGTGNDLDSPGFMQSFDAETGAVEVEALPGADESGRPRPRHMA